jgi:hypothetical protein
MKGGMQMKRALLVGIDNYPGTGSDLKGSVKDVEEWASLLMDKYKFTRENIRLLVDERATKEEVIKRLRWLKYGVGDGDTLVFIFSGHGATFTERHDLGHLDEAKDEALVLHGFGVDDMLIDDELSQIFKNMPSNVKLTIICDSCYSGGIDTQVTIDDESEKPPGIKNFQLSNDLEHRNDPNSQTRRFGHCLSKKEGLESSENYQKSHSKSLLLAACQETGVATASYPGTNGLSVFSHYAIQELRDSKQNLTAEKLIEQVTKKIEEAGFSQKPQLKGDSERYDKPLFI